MVFSDEGSCLTQENLYLNGKNKLCLFLIYSGCLPRPTAPNGKGGIRKSAVGTLKSRSTHVALAGNLMAESSGETAKNNFFTKGHGLSCGMKAWERVKHEN